MVLDRVAPRAFTFSRGDVVYLRDPSDPTAWRVRRLVAMEGDWVTAPRSDDVRKVPKGHCWLERARVDRRRREKDTNREIEHRRGRRTRRRGGGMMVPVALLDARVPFVLWPPRGFGPCDARRRRGEYSCIIARRERNERGRTANNRRGGERATRATSRATRAR